MKFNIPKILLYSRLAFAFIIVFITFMNPLAGKGMILFLLYTGVLTDIFDGILARKLNISSLSFRLLDTIFDLVFYLSVLFYINSTHPQAITDNSELILLILTIEGLMYFTSLMRFGKFPSPHALMSKFWGLYIVVEFSLLILGVPGSHFTIALCAGVLVHCDRLLIYILLPEWQHDIPSSYHALLNRNGKPIERNKIFNG